MITREEITKFYLNYRLYIFPVIVVLSCLILIIFVIYPQITKLVQNQKLQGQILNKSKFLDAKVEALEGYDSADLNQKVNFAINSYPTEQDFVSAIGVLQNLATQSGFNIVSINLGSGSNKAGNTQSYTLRLDISGPQTLIPLLLSNIEDSPKLMRVNSLDSGGGSQGAISLNVDILYAPAPKEFGNVDSPLPELSQKDQEIMTKLAKTGASVFQLQTASQLGPRGKANPFE